MCMQTFRGCLEIVYRIALFEKVSIPRNGMFTGLLHTVFVLRLTFVFYGFSITIRTYVTSYIAQKIKSGT